MRRLLEWNLLNNKSSSTSGVSYKFKDFSDFFVQLTDKIKKIWGCTIVECEPHNLELNLAAGVFRRRLIIKYDETEECFIVSLYDSATNKQIESLSCYGGFDVVLTVLVKHGIIKDKKLNEWIVMNNSTATKQSSIGHEEFGKIIKHLEDIYDCDRDRDLKYLYDTGFEISYGDQLDIYRLVIDFDTKTEKWTLFHIQTYPINKILKNYSGVGFNHLLNIMFTSKIIKDKTICESVQSSTIDEFSEYESMWDDRLLEWKSRAANNNNTTTTATSTAKGSSPSGITVYAWDMYLDTNKKGTFCSATKYKDGWDGTVFKTKAEAEDAGWNHLLELEDEGELSDDPDSPVLPWDYVIDTIAIPIEDVTKETLEWSGLDHLI